MDALVKQHWENEKERKKEEKEEAKGVGNTKVAQPAPTPALKQRQKRAQADATSRLLDTTGALPVAVRSGLLATGQQTTLAKRGRTDSGRQNADQDAQDMQNAIAGRSLLQRAVPQAAPRESRPVRWVCGPSAQRLMGLRTCSLSQTTVRHLGSRS